MTTRARGKYACEISRERARGSEKVTRRHSTIKRAKMHRAAQSQCHVADRGMHSRLRSEMQADNAREAIARVTRTIDVSGRVRSSSTSGRLVCSKFNLTAGREVSILFDS